MQPRPVLRSLPVLSANWALSASVRARTLSARHWALLPGWKVSCSPAILHDVAARGGTAMTLFSQLVESYRIPEWAQTYAETGYVAWPEFIDPEIAQSWEVSTRNLPRAKVHVGRETDSLWTEQGITNPESVMGGIAYHPLLIELIRTVAKLPGVDQSRTWMWINRYGPGDKVPEHRDQDGDTRLLLCLQGILEPTNGGELFIEGKTIPLRSGGAVLFRASELSHGMAPIRSTRLAASGFSRETAAIRFYRTT